MSGNTPTDSTGPVAPTGVAGPEPDLVDRRTFLALTGTAFAAGALLPGWLAGGVPQALVRGGGRGTRSTATATGVVEIKMGSDPTGARVWFDPNGASLRLGQTARWINESGVHTVTAYHPRNDRPLRIPGAAEPWDSGYLIEPGATFEITPEVEGIYDFFCRPHEAAGMVGRLVVLPSTGFDAHGVAEPAYSSSSRAGTLPQAAARGFPTVAEILGGSSTGTIGVERMSNRRGAETAVESA